MIFPGKIKAHFKARRSVIAQPKQENDLFSFDFSDCWASSSFIELIAFLSLSMPSSSLFDLSFPSTSTCQSVRSDPVSVSVTSGLLCSLSMSLPGFFTCDYVTLRSLLVLSLFFFCLSLRFIPPSFYPSCSPTLVSLCSPPSPPG